MGDGVCVCVPTGLLGEVFNCGLALVDEQGNFRKLAQMHHMTLYIIFMTHGFIDLLSYCGAMLPRSIAYLSAAVSFIWFVKKIYIISFSMSKG